jgi:hypothetical protein
MTFSKTNKYPLLDIDVDYLPQYETSIPHGIPHGSYILWKHTRDNTGSTGIFFS